MLRKKGGCMIKHVVMWKLKEFAEGADRAGNAQKLKTKLLALTGTIPQIVHLEVGINMMASDATYDVVLVSAFKNEQDLDIYQNHPDHRAVADFVGKIRENRVVVDYKADYTLNLPEWSTPVERTIKPDALKTQLVDLEHTLLLDVRRKTDYDADKDELPGAEWRDPDHVEEWAGTLPKDKTILLYCVRGGSVSNRVLDQLLERKLQARYLEGGIEAWKAAGGPLSRKN
jgi:rhodanese-related sulfurtransferase